MPSAPTCGDRSRRLRRRRASCSGCSSSRSSRVVGAGLGLWAAGRTDLLAAVGLPDPRCLADRPRRRRTAPGPRHLPEPRRASRGPRHRPPTRPPPVRPARPRPLRPRRRLDPTAAVRPAAPRTHPRRGGPHRPPHPPPRARRRPPRARRRPPPAAPTRPAPSRPPAPQRRTAAEQPPATGATERMHADSRERTGLGPGEAPRGLCRGPGRRRSAGDRPGGEHAQAPGAAGRQGAGHHPAHRQPAAAGRRRWRSSSSTPRLGLSKTEQLELKQGDNRCTEGRHPQGHAGAQARGRAWR